MARPPWTIVRTEGPPDPPAEVRREETPKAAEIRDRLALVRECDYRLPAEDPGCGCQGRFTCLWGVSTWDDLRVSDRDCLECVSQG